MSAPDFRSDRGQTLVELLMMITAISAMAVVTVNLVTNTMNESRFTETRRRLTCIRNALVGDPGLTQAGSRSSFGYQGDVGAIPTAPQGLSALWVAPAGVPVFAMNAGAAIGLGWSGPYLDVSVPGVDYTRDAWGNALDYNPAANPPTVVSYGANGAAGGTGYDQDITMELPPNVRTASVFGVIRDHAGPWSGAADIELNTPDGAGVLQIMSSSILAADDGAFTFSGVPLGIRSVKIYVPSKAAPTQVLGPVAFSVSASQYLIPAKTFDLAL